MDPNKLTMEELEILSSFAASKAYKVIKKYLIREERLIQEASHNAKDIYFEQNVGQLTHIVKKTRSSLIDENQGRTIMIHNFSAFINGSCKRLQKLLEKTKENDKKEK